MTRQHEAAGSDVCSKRTGPCVRKIQPERQRARLAPGAVFLHISTGDREVRGASGVRIHQSTAVQHNHYLNLSAKRKQN